MVMRFPTLTHYEPGVMGFRSRMATQVMAQIGQGQTLIEEMLGEGSEVFYSGSRSRRDSSHLMVVHNADGPPDMAS